MSRRTRKNRSSRRARRANRSNNGQPVKGPIIDWIRKIIGGILGPLAPVKGALRTQQNFQTSTVPGAYGNTLQPRFKMYPGADGVRVQGCDLVNSLPSEVNTDENFIFSTITANPCYWSGTRIAQVGAMYMNYRPIRMVFCYVPQVSVNQEGTVVMGTVWNGSAPQSNLQQTLFTSNGGMMTQCYVPAVTEIKLGSNLPQNIFNTNGPLEQSTNPFMFFAALRGARVVPGYFYVMYEYEFKNPLGEAWDFGVRYRTNTSSLPDYQVDNISVVPLSQFGEYGPGTVFGYDKVAAMLTYNNRLVPYNVSGSLNEVSNVAVYYNEQRPVKGSDDDDPIPPGPGPSPTTQIIAIRYIGENSLESPFSFIGAGRLMAAFQYNRTTDKVTFPLSSKMRLYVICIIQYLGQNGAALIDDPTITTRANIIYRVIMKSGGDSDIYIGYSGWYSVMGYIDDTEDVEADQPHTPYKLTTGKLVAVSSGSGNQIFELFPNRIGEGVYQGNSFMASAQDNVPSVTTLNLTLNVSNSSMLNFKMADDYRDVTVSRISYLANRAPPTDGHKSTRVTLFDD